MKDTAKTTPVMGRLVRDRDSAGEYGVAVSKNVKKRTEGTAVPQVGYSVYMYNAQRWWCTTPVTEILSRTDTEVRFKTKNSTYTLLLGAPRLTKQEERACGPSGLGERHVPKS